MNLHMIVKSENYPKPKFSKKFIENKYQLGIVHPGYIWLHMPLIYSLVTLLMSGT
jgi:hypothetical protein